MKTTQLLELIMFSDGLGVHEEALLNMWVENILSEWEFDGYGKKKSVEAKQSDNIDKH